MAEAVAGMEDTTEWPRCRNCGAPYRVPQWDREYACAACGSPLRDSAPGRRSISPLWILGAGAAVLAGGLIMRSIRADGVGATIPQQALPAPVPARIALPPHFEANLREKLSLLEADLARDPQNPGLLAAAALTSLSLAVATHQTAPDAPLIRKAERWARALEKDQRPGAAQVALKIHSASSLEWAAPTGMPLPAVLWPLQVGRIALFSEPGSVQRGSQLTSGRFFAPMPSGIGAPAPPRGASTRPRTVPRPPVNRPPAFGEAEAERELARLRERFAASPNDLAAGEQLGAFLTVAAGVSDQAELMADPKADSHATAYREEATQLYKTLATRSPTHSQKAAFLEAAAVTRGSANDWEAAYQLLKDAVQLAPFSPRIWRELQDAALQAGRLDDAESARFHAREWSFPDLKAPNALPVEPPSRLPDMPPPEPGRNGPE